MTIKEYLTYKLWTIYV